MHTILRIFAITVLACVAGKSVFGQTLVTAPMTGIPSPGQYYGTSSITLSPNFSFTAAAGQSLQLFIKPGCNSQPLNTAPSQNQNYIMTSVPRRANYNPAATSNTACDVMQNVQYFDGLGRPMQTVQVAGNNDATKDVVIPVYYDVYGREAQKYLPYTDGNNPQGAYRSNALQANAGVAGYYNAPSTGVQSTSAPYAQTVYEPTPLNRVVEQGGSGTTWQPVPNSTTGHTVKIDYEANVNNTIPHYEAEPGTQSGFEYMSTLSNLGSYYSGDLYITITYNENWVSGNGKTGTVEVYKDMDGRVVLKRIYADGAQPLSTYYIYDYKGNLSFVLPPGVNPDSGNLPTQAQLDNFCYQYRYDGRGRAIEKKLPGRDWDYLVYNTQDQVVMTQDPNLRGNNQWLFTKYDLFGRPIITGIYTCNASDNSRITQQGNVNTQPAYGETQDNSAGTGYTSTAYPYSGTIQYLTVTYYDNYLWPGASGLAAQNAYQTPTYNKICGTQVYTLDGTANYLTANYYDVEGRLIEVVSQNQLAGTDHVINTYDFTGQLLASNRTHVGNGATTTISTGYQYDHMGRELQTTESINGAAAILISQNNYNDIGQLYIKQLHSVDNGASFLQSITYSYNERGWLTKANGGANALFNFELRYDQPDAGITPNYNGNISEMLYYDAYTNASKTFNYTYDPLNRLTKALSTNDALDEQISYDGMGNISSLVRGGSLTANMSYNYTNPSAVDGGASNQLFGVTDPSNGANNRTYGYDGNGNATSDGMGRTITYNILNLPQNVSQQSNPNATLATYTYDAAGQKLTNVASNGTWQYDKGIVYYGQPYSNTTPIYFIQTEEGRALRNPDGSYSYEYNLKDQLGNVRVSFTSGANGNAQITQKDDYYAFGLKAAGEYIASVQNRYLYNGKEIQTDLSNQYDYGARFYDPVIGRWTSVDPLAEKSRRFNPYNYTEDNPIINIDPDGMERQGFRYQPLEDMDDGADDLLGNNSSGSTAPRLTDEQLDAVKNEGGDDAVKLYNDIMNGVGGDNAANTVGGGKGGGKNDANQGGPGPALTHAQELAKYGQIVAAYNLSGGASYIYFGGTVEAGIVLTDKGWARAYNTFYYSPGIASPSGALGVTAIYPVNSQYLPTFQDWKGAMVGFSGSLEVAGMIGISGNVGMTSTYWATGVGVSVGTKSLSFPFTRDNKEAGSMNVGYTIWNGPAFRVGNLYIPNATEIYLHQMQNGGW